MDVSIAIDIGGTEIKHGIIDMQGNIVFKNSIATEAEKGGEYVLGLIENIVDTLMQDKAVKPVSIGISTPGQVDLEKGLVAAGAKNIPDWAGIPVRDILQKQYKIPVYIENDVNAAALGELLRGAGQGESNFVMVTLGTGIGGAIITEGKLYRGKNGYAGELGHICLIPGGEECSCGLLGCFQQYGSTKALIKSVYKRLEEGKPSMLSSRNNITGLDIFNAVQMGDELACECIDQWADYIAWGLSIITHSLDPGIIIIGGGVSAQGQRLIDIIEQKLQSMLAPQFRGKVEIRGAKLLNDAALIGISSLHFSNEATM